MPRLTDDDLAYLGSHSAEILAPHVQDLIADLREARQTIQVLWRALNRDQKVWADEDLAEAGLPEVESGYRAQTD
jgi:hypothetical protein